MKAVYSLSILRNRLLLLISILVACQVLISKKSRAFTCESPFIAKHESLTELRKKGQPSYPGPVGEWAWNQFIEKSTKTRILHVGNKTYIASKDPKELQEITSQLGSRLIPKRSIIFTEMSDWIFYPLNLKALSHDLRRLLGFTAIYDNARCYSAMCKALDYKSYIIDTGSNESEFILSSELFEPITLSELQKGDVIAIGPGNYPSNHVAFMVTDSLVFHKASPMAENHIELVPWSSFLNYYDNFSEGAKFFRPKMTFWEYVYRNRKRIPTKAMEVFKELKTQGEEIEKYILTRDQDRYFEQDDSFFEEFQQEVDRSKEKANTWIEYAEAELKSAKSRGDKVQEFIFQSIIHRASAFYSVGGPYDD